jgi:hypothetical protein
MEASDMAKDVREMVERLAEHAAAMNDRYGQSGANAQFTPDQRAVWAAFYERFQSSYVLTLVDCGFRPILIARSGRS